MKITTRYVLRELLVPFGLWVSFLFLLLTVMQFLRGTDVLLGSAVTAGDVGRMILYMAPHFLVMALPVAFLLAVLIGLGRLTEDRELVALESLGVSPLWILSIPLAVAALLGVAMLALTWTAEPWGLTSMKTLVSQVVKKNLIGDVKAGVFYEDLNHLTLYAEKVDKKRGLWTHVLLHDARDAKSPLLVLAGQGHVNPAGPGADLTVGLSEGEVHRGQVQGADYTVLGFGSAEIAVGVQDAIFKKNRFRSPREELTPNELLEAAAQAREEHHSPAPLLVAYHTRLAQGLVPLAFALVGGPLAMGSRKQGRGQRYLLTISAYVAYYVLSRMFETWGGQGKLPPWTAAQLANVLFVVAGVWLLRRRTVGAGRLA